MFMLGFALLGSTLLLPLFSQTLLGYTAQQAGLALMPGGFTIIFLLPLVGFLLSRYTPRWLLLFGLVVLSFSLFHMTSFDLQIDFRTVATARADSGGGHGVPVCSDQHGCVRLPAARQEQRRIRIDESGAQHRRQCGNFCGHDHA